MPNFQIINADVIAGLQQLPTESVHCVVTSPPYWALRNYLVDGQIGLEPSPEEYLEKMVKVFRHVRRVMHPSASLWVNMGDSYCSDAGADRAPTTLAGPRVPAGWTNRAQPQRVHAVRAKSDVDPKRGAQNANSAPYKAIRPQGSLKPKDMCMMPARLALALQADGWFLRSQIPWLKQTAMPESVNDRPTNAVEYIYLLSKSEDYFYDKEAIRMAASANTHSRGDGVNPKAMGPNSRMVKDQDPAHQKESNIRARQDRSFSAAVRSVVSTRARRNSDWFFSSLRSYSADFRGLLVGEDADPLAMLVNSQPFAVEMCGQCSTVYDQADYRKLAKNEKDRRVCNCGAVDWISHFATFPQRLVEPLILAGTSEHGCCEHCFAPYERIVEEREPVGDWHPDPPNKHAPGAMNGTAKWAKQNAGNTRNGDNPHSISQACGAHDRAGPPAPATIGWRPTCSHPLFPCGVIPCSVLDPFAGSGRTGIAALKHKRSFIGVELSERYTTIARWQHQNFDQVVR